MARLDHKEITEKGIAIAQLVRELSADDQMRALADAMTWLPIYREMDASKTVGAKEAA